MWMDKVSDGVLRVLTPLGPRYIKPSLLQRLYLVWIFRHFDRLPQQVLSTRQQRLVDELYMSQHFVSLWRTNGAGEVPVIGTVERRPVVLVEEAPARRPMMRAAEPARTPLADQQSS